jgi:isoquinoline 1-oxidoreductase beta subunit
MKPAMKSTVNRSIVNQSRRDFLKATAVAGGGLSLELCLPGAAFGAADAAAGAEINAWVVINADDSVVIRVARSEMGQGSSTGLPMLVAEELECDWSRVRIEYVLPAENLRRNRAWGTLATGGSRATRDSQSYLRKAGATAREMLIAAAAAGWKVPPGECFAESSVITHRPSGRQTTFGKVAAAAAKLVPPKDVALKDPKSWKILGKPVKRFDTPDTVLGRPLYGIDVSLPGMLHASIAQSPVFGGKVKRVDAAKALAMRGVKKVVEIPGAVAVIADNWWRANQALKALTIEWDTGDSARVTSESIQQTFRAGLDDPKAAVARKEGDVGPAFASAAKIVEAEYFTPFLNHATMEPMNCTALVKGDRVEIWTPSQSYEGSLATAAEAAGVPLANVEVNRTQLGGGFGRRGAFQDYVRQAVLIAKQIPGTPVKLLWSREEDMQHDFYRPAALVRQKAAIDAAGKVTAWQSWIAAPSILTGVRPEAVNDGHDPSATVVLADMPYAVPNIRVTYAMRNTHVPVGFWRAVGHSQNPFFRECFLDEIAHAAGRDPYQLRRELSEKSPKYLGVLDACAKAAGWGTKLAAGVHRGIAVVDAYGSYAAAVIEASVSGDGELSVKRVVVAVDPGYVVNPDAATAQVESCVVFGLTAAYWGENTIRDGRVEQKNFDDYRMMLFREMPKVETVLVPSGGFWGGMGEPPLAALAPALVNAIFAATGRRIRSLPLKNHGIRVA